MEESKSLQNISKARQMLAEAKTLDDVLMIRDKAEAVRVYAAAAKLGLESQNEAAEIKIRAERKAGELLREMPKAKGGEYYHEEPTGCTVQPVEPPPPSIWGAIRRKNMVKIDNEFKRYIRPLNQHEYDKLKESILAEGIRDSLICWDGILLDGYHRYQIAQENDLEYRVTEIELLDRDAAKEWMITNQLGRRNLTPEEASYYRGKLYEARKQHQYIHPKSVHQNDARSTAEIIANEYGVSKPTVERDAVFSRAVDRVAEVAGDDIRDAILSGAAKVPKQDVDKLLDIHEQAPELLPKIASGEMTIPDARREVKKREVITSLESVEAKEAKVLEGVYDVIVIDPPWAMQKIERDVAPEQVAFEYPTMTLEEIADMKIPAADNCHVFLWTTQKFLPSAFALLTQWQFKYVCTFVWHKNGGFQPFGLPQYNCEFAIYARKGTPQFIDFKNFLTCFSANRGKHSEKPEEFYDVVRRVTAGRRLDMFNRRAIDGFDTWGKEAA